MRRALLTLLFLSFATATCFRLDFSSWKSSAIAGEKPASLDYVRDIQPLLTKYCLSCHNDKKKRGELSLEFKDLAAAAKDRKVWEKVAHQIRTGEMPPMGRPKPTVVELDRFNTWIDRDMLAVDCSGKRDPGRVTIRRLNKAEYDNTIRDLLGVKANLSADFPSDDVGYGFDNIGDVLTLSPLLMERYMAAAGKAVDLAWKDFRLRGRILGPPRKVRKSERARQILEKFAERAYRRPVEAGEVAKLTKFVDLAEASGQSFEQGIQLALKAALCSPHFLFRVELDRAKPGESAPLSDFELASRLSYFLWSSMPDEELFRVARSGELQKGDSLEKQVRRMMQDPRAAALTKNFAGQWLQLRSLAESSPDPKLFPSFNPNLRRSMIRETELFFETLLREDQSILKFVDADFTFVDEDLARHYGIDGVKGKEFQRVRLDPDRRGGILTMASILTVTSNPNRTSPVKRGKWILENILNAPPPPPAPDVPELEAQKELKGSLRERMEQHRAKPACATCHQRMDPLGFAFENFDAIGRWRTQDEGFKIDPSGELPDGRKFSGARELRQILLARAPDFRRCLAEKMLTYALGRGLEYADKCAVDDICTHLTRNEDRFSALLIAVVQSEPFRLRRGLMKK